MEKITQAKYIAAGKIHNNIISNIKERDIVPSFLYAQKDGDYMASYFELIDTYNSYAGTDIIVTAQLAFKNNEKLRAKCYVLGSLQTISISTHQDKRPVRAIGNINAIDYVMGQRTIAGSLVFAVFDRHFADEIFEDLRTYTKGTILLSDEIPPLNLTISFANEYGKKSKMALYGVRMLNEGQVMSINDLYTENTYQFVALGIEPLKAENSSYQTENEDKKENEPMTYTKNPMAFQYSEEKIYTKNPLGGVISFDNLSNKIDKNDYDINKTIDLYYAINQPIVANGNGILSFNTNTDKTNIYITDKKNDESINLDNVLNHSDSWYIELPQGEYTLEYSDKENSIKSPVYNIFVKYEENINKQSDYPIINVLTHDSVIIESNNSNHSTLVIEEISNAQEENLGQEKILSYSFTKNKCQVNNLKPNTTYKIYTTDSTETFKSDSVRFSTLSNENYSLDSFIQYVRYNKKILINDFSDFDFDSLYNNGLTILDKILLIPNSSHKQELLLYAIKWQNLFLDVINEKSLSRIKNKDLLNIKIDNTEISKLNIYRSINEKEYFIQSYDNFKDTVFLGNNNQKHLIQGIDKNNLKTPKYNLVYFNQEDKNNLKPYLNINNLYKIDINGYNYKYPKYNQSFIKAIISKEKNTPNSYLLEEPNIYMENDNLIVDVNYNEYLQDEKYFLCIASIVDSLDYTPVNKIEFTRENTILNLSKIESLISKDNYYLAWIENEYFSKISDSCIISSYENIDNLTHFKNSIIKNKLDLVFKILKTQYANKLDFLDTVYEGLLSLEIPVKDFGLYLEQEIINQGTYSNHSFVLDELLKYCIEINYINTKDLCEKIIINNNILEFIAPKNSHMVSIDYYLDEDAPTKNYHDDFTLDLSQKSSHYTLIYLIEKSMFNRSGFILINNISKKIYNYKLYMEVK